MTGDAKSILLLTSSQTLISVTLIFLNRNVECDEPLKEWLIGLCILSITYNVFKMELSTTHRYVDKCHFILAWIMIIWCAMGRTMVASCKSCNDKNNDIYPFGQWCLFMLYSLLIYHFCPIFALIVVILITIMLIPIFSCLEWFGLDFTQLLIALMQSLQQREGTIIERDRFNHLFLSQFPIIAYKNNVASDNGINECGICLSKYVENDKLRVLPCLHRFHSECVDEWIIKTQKCPMCRHAMHNILTA